MSNTELSHERKPNHVLNLEGLSALEKLTKLSEFSASIGETRGPLSPDALNILVTKLSQANEILSKESPEENFEQNIKDCYDGILLTFSSYGYGILRDENKVTIQLPTEKEKYLMSIVHQAIIRYGIQAHILGALRVQEETLES